MSSDPSRDFLRHTVASLAYRAARACENAPPGFAEFRASPATRSAGEILAHMGDLFDWATSIVVGKQAWNTSKPQAWDAEVERFFAALGQFDAELAKGERVDAPLERLFQGPIADALTHVGQLAMLRRAAGSPQLGENYFRAEIGAGQIIKDLPPAAAPFR
jgi:hypothetical protein